MFRDDAQAHRAIRTLLETLPGLERLWTSKGPTEEALRIVEARSGEVSAEKMLLVRVAFDIFDQRVGAELGQVAHTLGYLPLEAIGSLLAAIARGPAAIDSWITLQTAITQGNGPD